MKEESVEEIKIAEEVIKGLRGRGLTLATAESCTGGNVAHLITSVAGCSDVYKGGVVSYCNEVKERTLGVSHESLIAEGAVSRPVVEQMTDGACRVMEADCSVATSGIAGPGGAVPGKPVGTVWISARTPEKHEERVYHFKGERKAVIEAASEAALVQLLELLCEN